MDGGPNRLADLDTFCPPVKSYETTEITLLLFSLANKPFVLAFKNTLNALAAGYPSICRRISIKAVALEKIKMYIPRS